METKFNIGDDVHIWGGTKPYVMTVDSIYIDKYSIKYNLKCKDGSLWSPQFLENECFSSSEELKHYLCDIIDRATTNDEQGELCK